MAAISFVIACKARKIAQIAQNNQLFYKLLNFIRAFSDAFCGLSRMLMSKYVNKVKAFITRTQTTRTPRLLELSPISLRFHPTFQSFLLG